MGDEEISFKFGNKNVIFLLKAFCNALWNLKAVLHWF
jgi:hypothetical protein